jgi:Fe-S-cluster-containing dehydrogenase component/CRP-like cAMP-binding protein
VHDPDLMDPRDPADQDLGPPGAGAWPAVVWDAPVLRGLDARGRREIADAGRIVAVPEQRAVYRAGQEGASFFIVASGKVALFAQKRGDDAEAELRTVAPGESFGEESTVGLARRGSAVALVASTVAEIPVHLFQRAAVRSDRALFADRLMRTLARAATADLLGTLAFTRDLAPREKEALLDAIVHRRAERGHHVYRQGDPATIVFLIADGMVQIQTEEEGRLHVRAYLSRGDFFGDVEVLEATPRRTSAVASGPSLLLAVPGAVFRDLVARSPALVPALRRLAEDQEAAQRAVVAKAAANATQHVFRDLYRLQIARSLLVIDLESCVRCGHCAWACSETYGVARLVRRGDKVVARVAGSDEGAEAPQHLMLPNSCQHCENPACMVGCPTGAIGRDPSGEVFLRDELCTGCGACAKACPWDNIQIAARPADARRPLGGAFPEIAVKCDLCRGYEGPACVQACPTGSIFRVNPAEELADVRALFAAGARTPSASAAQARAPLLVTGAAIAAAGIGASGWALQSRGQWQPGRGAGLAAGALAAVGMLALLFYAVPKRGVRAWLRPRVEAQRAPRAPSLLKPQLDAHLGIGLVTVGLAFAHARPLGSLGYGGALFTALLATSLAGACVALAYRFVPPRLSRIERTAALPEDFARARQELVDRLYRDASGKSELVKKILERFLLPYSASTFGPLALLLSGRRLREEEAALRARIDAALEGRGKERLAGLPDLTRIVVEMRALSAQRALLFVLRAGLPLHIVSFAIAVALLGLHAALALGSRL